MRILAALAFLAAIGLTVSGTWAVMDMADKHNVTVVEKRPRIVIPAPHDVSLPQHRFREFDI